MGTRGNRYYDNDTVEMDNLNSRDNAEGSENGAVDGLSAMSNASENTAVWDPILDIKPSIESLRVRMSSKRNIKVPRRYCKTDKSAKSKKSKKPTVAKTLKCNLCAYKAANKHALKVHSQVHSSEKPFPCGDCDKRFGYRCNLNAHLKQKHNVIVV